MNLFLGESALEYEITALWSLAIFSQILALTGTDIAIDYAIIDRAYEFLNC